MAVNTHFQAVAACLDQIDQRELIRFRDAICTVHERQGVIWLAGNGGSFATAQHWAADLSKAARIKARALGSNQSLTTALANDEIFAIVFQTELLEWATVGDLLICFSCSGTSPNVVAAISAAREIGCASWLLTGNIAEKVAADRVLRIPSSDYGVIEDCHSAIGHWLVKELI